jgi:hypothetical protein
LHLKDQDGKSNRLHSFAARLNFRIRTFSWARLDT